MTGEFTIRRVDPLFEDVAEDLRYLHDSCFGDEAPYPAGVEDGWWWLVAPTLQADHPIAFAGMRPAKTTPEHAYLWRAGVLPAYRGKSLQRRLIRVREAHARRQGFRVLVTDTHPKSLQSSNNLIRCGFRLYEPNVRWAFPNSLYWRKVLQ